MDGDPGPDGREHPVRGLARRGGRGVRSRRPAHLGARRARRRGAGRRPARLITRPARRAPGGPRDRDARRPPGPPPRHRRSRTRLSTGRGSG